MKYITTETLEFHLGLEYSGADYQITCKKTNHVLVHLSAKGILTVYPDFTWDGCSPKYKIKNTFIGVWDGKEQFYPQHNETCQQLKYPSLVHDALCQLFHSKKHFHYYTRRDIDIIFCNMMKQYGVSLLQRKSYYYAVRLYAKLKYPKYE